MTQTDSQRLAQIRTNLLEHEAAGIDTSTWEATFFIGLFDRQNEELRKLKKEIK